MRRRSLIFFLLLICALCGASAAAETIRVGVIQSLTGIAAEDGKTVVHAMQLAADDINAKGEAKVELLIEDDGTQPKNAVSAFEKLSAQGVAAIVGATWDFTTNAVLAMAGRKGTVVFNTSTLPESLSLSAAGGFAFINAVTAEDEAAAFDRYLARRRPKSMAVVFANNAWGETQLRIYKEIAGRYGAAAADELRSTAYDANEWNVLVTRLKLKAPELVLLLLNKNDLEMFLRKAGELGLKASFFASKNLFDAWRGSSAKGLFNDVCFTYPMEQLANETEFRRRYQARFGEEARIYADSSYDALFIIVRGVEASRSRKVSLREALPSVTYDGLVGRYGFTDAKSFSLGSSSLVCIRDGAAKAETGL